MNSVSSLSRKVQNKLQKEEFSVVSSLLARLGATSGGPYGEDFFVLSSGIQNFLAVQGYTDTALLPLRRRFPTIKCIHYMDGILITARDAKTLDEAYCLLNQILMDKGLYLAPEKVQMDDIVNYLGSKLDAQGHSAADRHMNPDSPFRGMDRQDPIWVPERLTRKIQHVAANDEVDMDNYHDDVPVVLTREDRTEMGHPSHVSKTDADQP
ncbi:hypothetical protein STEG23_015452 [Scotinomys teguina]